MIIIISFISFILISDVEVTNSSEIYIAQKFICILFKKAIENNNEFI